MVIKFKTKVLKNGIIKMPDKTSLVDNEVEVIVIPRSSKPGEKMSGKDFIEKWSGFLKSKDTDNLKYKYLSQKYK